MKAKPCLAGQAVKRIARADDWLKRWIGSLNAEMVCYVSDCSRRVSREPRLVRQRGKKYFLQLTYYL